MVDGGKFLVQLLRCAIGFIAGVVCCGLFLAWGFFTGGQEPQDAGVFALVIGSGLVSASVVGASVFVPALVLVALAEVAAIRSFVYHLGAGGLLAFALWSIGDVEGVQSGADLSLRPGTAIALAAGFLGGFVYWLLAGRLSGCWKTVKDDPASR
ncbi:translation initiation factor IF-3 [Roseibium limicola]|uniref:Translation initiation factor IF-3 n=1 Tax=Roseibium limicola TaxID=2816037 RepID=A0A939JA46_9HYPH|nr:translation initiation factor IF-3 [Roseibium limicola]MBO0346569.1 translation initiation factor IF-3 [Roseibium limicola]